MKCSAIRGLLPDYIRRELDPKDEKRVREHLASCSECSEALAFYRTYVKETGSIRAKEAPDDFLEKVKARLQRSSPFRELLSKLFLPFPVKVPLELAGVTALVLFVILVIQPFPEMNRMQEFPEMSGKAVKEQVLSEKTPGMFYDNKKTAEEVLSKDSASEKAEDFGKAKKSRDRNTGTSLDLADDLKKRGKNAAGGETVPAAQPENGVLNIALVPRQQGPLPVEKTSPVSESEAPDSFAKGAVSQDKELKRSIRKEERLAASDEQQKAKSARSAEADQNLPSVQTGKMDQAVQGIQVLAFTTNDLRRITSIVTNLKGRVLAQQTKKTSQDQQFLNIEIPARNYSRLLNQLNKDYNLQKSLPSNTGRNLNKTRIQLQKQASFE
jgi:hypothetical protein